ncbi:MAG: DUF4442 domain-containing protein [Sphingomonas sp.]
MYDMLKAGLSAAVPFSKYVGVELQEVGGGFAKARLEQRPDVSNHIGTIHAGALFTAAETASGAAVAGAFVDLIGAIRPVAAKATVTYLKLARGTAICTAETSQPADELVRRLRADHKVVFDVVVTVADDSGQRLAMMSVSWDVRLVAT